MLDILTPEGALSFIIYRVSRESVMRVIESYFNYNGLSLRWIRVKKLINQKKIIFFVFFVKHKMQSLIKKSM